MEQTTIDPGSNFRAQSVEPPNVVRMIVVSNSQIYSNVSRASLLILLLAFVLQFLRRAIPAGPFKDIVQSFDIALIAVAVGLFILGFFLERALRRCPICRTRITSVTEEKRRCLECDTELWGYWDE